MLIASCHFNLINKIIKDKKRREETRLLESGRRVWKAKKLEGDATVRETINYRGDFLK